MISSFHKLIGVTVALLGLAPLASAQKPDAPVEQQPPAKSVKVRKLQSDITPSKKPAPSDYVRYRSITGALKPVEEPVLERGSYLGVACSPVSEVLRRQLKLPEGTGLVVDYVEPESPAQTAGIDPHDVLIRLNEQILVNPPQLAV